MVVVMRDQISLHQRTWFRCRLCSTKRRHLLVPWWKGRQHRCVVRFIFGSFTIVSNVLFVCLMCCYRLHVAFSYGYLYVKEMGETIYIYKLYI